eukprot:7129426-Pyramimonas_sp.AAC.1
MLAGPAGWSPCPVDFEPFFIPMIFGLRAIKEHEDKEEDVEVIRGQPAQGRGGGGWRQDKGDQ